LLFIIILYFSQAMAFGQATSVPHHIKPLAPVGLPTALELAVPHMTRIAPDVWVAPLAPGLWVHTTTSRLSDGTIYPANGMLLETRKASVLIDTGWNPQQTRVLLSWARNSLHHPVQEAIVTHFHIDRLGGTPALAQAHIPIFGLSLTRRLAIQHHKANPPQAIPNLETHPWMSPDGFEVYYPGPGHTRDNIVVYFPKQRILFGGCFLKSITESDLGNLEDADVPAWPASMRRLQATYPEARLVVPGHGALKGNALEHTKALLKTHR